MKILMCIKLYYHAPFIYVCDCPYGQEYFIKLLYLFHVPNDYDTWKHEKYKEYKSTTYNTGCQSIYW